MKACVSCNLVFRRNESECPHCGRQLIERALLLPRNYKDPHGEYGGQPILHPIIDGTFRQPSMNRPSGYRLRLRHGVRTGNRKRATTKVAM
jgi:hypothetical protein